MILYIITNKANGKRYIGQTIQPLSRRWSQHLYKHKKKTHYLSNAIHKYGKENFEVKVLARCNSIEEMNHREQYYIKLFNTLAPNGYNLTHGGANGKRSQESKNKMSKSLLGRKSWAKGLTKETDFRVASWGRKGKEHHCYGKIGPMKGKTHSEETKKRLSEVNSGKNHRNFGKHYSEEYKIKLSESANNRKVCIFCPENNKTYKSITEAAKDVNSTPGNIHNVLTGKYKTTKGLTFIRIVKNG